MKSIVIRRATTDDVQILLPLVSGYWDYEGVPGFEAGRVSTQLTRLLSEPHLGNGWIAFAGDVAVGYLLAFYAFSLEHLGLTAEIDELFVSLQHRGKGVGSEMLRTAEREFVGAGCTHVSLQLSRGNDSAHAFYHRNGYTEKSRYELLDKMLHDGQ